MHFSSRSIIFSYFKYQKKHRKHFIKNLPGLCGRHWSHSASVHATSLFSHEEASLLSCIPCCESLYLPLVYQPRVEIVEGGDCGGPRLWRVEILEIVEIVEGGYCGGGYCGGRRLLRVEIVKIVEGGYCGGWRLWRVEIVEGGDCGG